MLNKYSTLVLGAMLGLGTLAFSGAGASAAAMLPLAPAASGGLNEGIVQVKHKNNNYNKNWNKKRFNNNCYYKNCRHKYRRDRFDRSDLFFPLIIGGFGAFNYYDYDRGYGYGNGYGGVSSKHVRWCLNRYRSYNVHTNLWRAYSGKIRQCVSPYY